MKKYFPVAAFGTLFLLLLTLFPLTSNDLWWHLATGRLIAGSGIPHLDPFSFASSGTPWVNHAWGFDLILYRIVHLFSLHALVIVRIAIAGCIGLLLFIRRRGEGETPLTALGWVLCFLALMRPRFFVRPELAALLLFVILLHLLRREGWRPFIYAAIILLFWVNLHASFLLGLAVALLFLLDRVIATKRPIALLFAPLLAGVTLINPFTFRAWSAPFGLIAALHDLPVINPEWVRPPFLLFAPLYILIVVALYCVIVKARKRETAVILLLLALSVLASSSVRNIGFFAVGAAFFLPPILRRSRAYLPLLGALVLTGWQVLFFIPPSFTLLPPDLPTTTVDLLASHPGGGNLYNEPGMGGYLIWKLYPARKVFIDGRNELYLPLLPKINEARRDLTVWNRILDAYGIKWAILPYRGEIQVRLGGRTEMMPSSLGRFPPGSWDLIDYDDGAMLFIKHGAGMGVKPMKVCPESLSWIVRQIKKGVWSREEVIREVMEKVKRDPACQRARDILFTLQNAFQVNR